MIIFWPADLTHSIVTFLTTQYWFTSSLYACLIFHQLSHLYRGHSWIFLPVISVARSTVSRATEVLAFYWTSFLLIIPRCSTWCIFTHAFFSILMVDAVCDDLFAEKNTYHIHMVPVASASSNLDLFLFHSHLPNPNELNIPSIQSQDQAGISSLRHVYLCISSNNI